MDNPLVSIAIPYYGKMKNADFFLKRAIDSLLEQTYENWELVVTEEGNASHNTNKAIQQSKGDLIKILYMDDYFTHSEALGDIVRNFKGNWLITGCNNNLEPVYTGDIHLGNNKLGSPSVLTIKKGCEIMFDEDLVWLLDCDFYKKMYKKYGKPVILNGDYMTIGEGSHQATNKLTNNVKESEILSMRTRYV